MFDFRSSTTLPAGLRKFERQSPRDFKKAMKQGAVQLLNWSNNGSLKTNTSAIIWLW